MKPTKKRRLGGQNIVFHMYDWIYRSVAQAACEVSANAILSVYLVKLMQTTYSVATINLFALREIVQ